MRGLAFISFAIGAHALVTTHQVPVNNWHDSSLSDGSGYTLDLNEMRLVRLGEFDEPIWMSELDKVNLKAAGINFMDVTDTPNLASQAANFRSTAIQYPTSTASKSVKKVISTLSTEGPKAHLEKFTSFRTRYYRSATGKKSQEWLLSRVKDITKEFTNSEGSDIHIGQFEHPWGQNTIVARFNGTSASDEIVIVGAHQDSTNLFPFLPAPGADDDGSGTVTILEAYRALVASGFSPERSVEFHWYSAEEGGLLGSQAVADHYAKHGANVLAMLQMDMTAWVQKGTKEEVGIVTDFTDPKLSGFISKLVDQYLDIPSVNTKCGYACSDHASWREAGYASAFTIESAFEKTNKHIHSMNDRIDISPEFSFDHMLEFSKLAVAFAMELGKSS